MMDAQLLNNLPDYLSITQMLKASPSVENGERIIYIEASNEALDQQNEMVMAKALADSADYYLRFGNLDLDHLTQIGAKGGIADYALYEIGRPLEVKVTGGRTLVKGQVYSGTGPVAEKANQFWSSLTEISPPQRWYPSVGGAVLEKALDIDPKTGAKRAVIKKVRWTNIGFSKTPVNAAVPTVSTVPFEQLAKCWGPGGLDISKALEAGHGTDVAELEGGGALRKQSLHGTPINYFDMRDRLAGALRRGSAGKNPGARDLVEYATREFGLSRDDAAETVERFMRDLKTGREKRRKS